MPSDRALYDAECVVVTLLVVGYGLVWLVRRLAATRPGLGFGRPVATAFGLRILAAAGISLTSVAGSLRGGDEQTFAQLSHDIANSPIGSGQWTDALTSG